MPEPVAIHARGQAKANALAHPLDKFYEAAGRELPVLKPLRGEQVPEPFRSLLVHENDMTPTLETFHGGEIHLEVLGKRQTGQAYFREVILRLNGSDRPVEFGAIQINLDRFPKAARDEILRERLPLGHILEQFKITHTSRPHAYLSLAADALISPMFGVSEGTPLYGRRNTLYDPEQFPLAEIIEILPPHHE